MPDRAHQIRRCTAIVLGLASFAFAATTAAANPAPATAAAFSESVVAAQPAATDARRTNRSAGILALDWGDIDATRGAWRGNYVVLQPWEGGRIRSLKAKNPRIKVLMYKDVSAVRKDAHESGIYSTGLSYRDAARNGWLLRDRSGRLVEWSDWRGLYPTNVANRAYQRRWGTKVLAELKRHDWDGVMMDDVLTGLSHTTVGNRVPAKFPTNKAMYRGTESFLSHVGPRIKRAGFMAVPNLTVEWNNWRSTLKDWTRYVSGWENEYFVKWGLDAHGERFLDADWEWKMRMAAWLARRNVPLLAITYSNRWDTGVQVYHRATWLLTWNGRTGASIFVPDEANTNHWTPKAMVEIGRPTGKKHRLGETGLWRRTYSHGLVLVNPTGSARTVRVGPGYRNLAGQQVTTVQVRSRAGVILR